MSDAHVRLPRTAVPLGIDDPVARARAELKAALAAIEEKANVPRRAGRALDRRVIRARTFARDKPAAAAAIAVGAALAAGVAVWGAVRLFTR